MCSSRGTARRLNDLLYMLADGQVLSGTLLGEFGDAEDDCYLVADFVNVGVGWHVSRFFTLTAKGFAGGQIL